MTPIGPQIGDRIESTVVEGLTRTQIVQYAGASGDFNRLHTDEDFATSQGFASVFAHGMLSMGLTSRLLYRRVPAEWIHRFGVRFAAQVWPGDTLTATATVTSVEPCGDCLEVELDVRTRNQQGATVVSGGATVRIPPGGRWPISRRSDPPSR